jgi:hypothetical protein
MELIIGRTLCFFWMVRPRDPGRWTPARLAGRGFRHDKTDGAQRSTTTGRESRRFTRTGVTPFALARGRRRHAEKSVD